MSEAGGFVVDSCVVIRWYVDQVGYQHAREVHAAVLGGRLALQAPDVLRWEVGDVLRKRGVTTGLLAADDVIRVLTGLDSLGVLIHPTAPADVSTIARLAIRLGISSFDAAFVSLSLRTGLPLLTADARLARAVGGLISTELLRGVSA